LLGFAFGEEIWATFVVLLDPLFGEAAIANSASSFFISSRVAE